AAQLAALVFPGFVAATGMRRLPDLSRYLRAMQRRLEKLPESPDRDLVRQRSVEAVTQDYEDALRAAPDERGRTALADVRWMIEELRVSLFAQVLGTAYPVSETRIRRALAAALD
ncbi:MAG: DUF3418 domain-containing protein, partial [Streptosporangiales bacterium]|nr:DUF3418 domain-containing protein [Streptosporangiales bacterium]